MQTVYPKKVEKSLEQNHVFFFWYTNEMAGKDPIPIATPSFKLKLLLTGIGL